MAIDAARAKSLFLATSDLDPAERAAYLDRECGDDAELRGRVEALLRANDAAPLPPAGAGEATVDSEHGGPRHGATGEYTPQPDDAAPLRPPGATDFRPEVEPGTVIAGRYALVEVIGEGGMGSVYLASQTEPVKRQVALKLIRSGMDSKAVLARFDAERQALALMDHPNIARIYDGGVTPAGQPFFVMELVTGVPLTEYCDAQRLSVAARLQLFVAVCQAVQHAHQKGIIHRDLKPGNVLVTEVDGRPTPKVIDFGVAKATEQKLTDLSFSDVGAIVGTPAYMSPEQADPSCQDIDTRTDVYALGVMLYELLTGSPPIDASKFKRGAILEMLRMVREVEPPRPSTKLSTADALPSIAANRSMDPAKLSKLLQGELDWVVMKALEKDRTRRYETANGLARDIQRYLADEIVEARPPSAGYRLRKFVKRHKGQVIAASLVFLTLICGLAGTGIGMVQANLARKAESERAEGERLAKLEAEKNEKLAVEQRTRAEKARDRTRDVLDAMTSSVTGESLSTQKEISEEQKKFLAEVLTYYREFAGERVDDEQSRARTSEAAFRVGMIESRLGRNEHGIAALQMARDGYQALATDFPTVPAYRLGLAHSLGNLGLLLKALGKRAEAEEHYRQSLAIGAKLVAEFPTVPDYRRETGASHNNLGVLLNELGRRAEAEEQFRQALTIREKLAADFPAVPYYRSQLASGHDSLGSLLTDHGKNADAEGHYRKALAIREKLVADFPTMHDLRRDLAGTYDNLALLLRTLGKQSDAERHHRQALALRERLAAEFPSVPDHRKELAVAHSNLGNLLVTLRKAAEAEEQFRKSLVIREKLATDFPTVPEFREGLSDSHNNLGNSLVLVGKRTEAEEQYRQALAVRTKLAADFPTVPVYRERMAGFHTNVGGVLAGAGKRAEAVEQFRQALTVQEKLAADFPTVPEYRQQQAGSHNNLGVMLGQLGKRTEAEEHYRQALAIQEKLAADFPAVPDYRKSLAMSHANLGNRMSNGGEFKEAETHYRQALAILEKLVGDVPAVPEYRQLLAGTHGNLAVLQRRVGKSAAVEEQYRKALAIQEQLAADFPTVPDYRRDLAMGQSNLGKLLASLGNQKEAEEQFRQAITIQTKLVADFPTVPDYRKELARGHNGLGVLLMELGKSAEVEAEAEQQFRKALAIQEKLAADFPTVPEYRQALAWTCSNLGVTLKSSEKWAEAEELSRKAVALRERLAADVPTHPGYQMELADSLSNLGIVLERQGKSAEAEGQYRKAVAIQEKMAAIFRVPDVQVGLGGSYCNYGELILKAGRAEESLGWFEKAIATLEPVNRAEPRNVTAKQFLANSLSARAGAYHRLKRYPEAIKDFDRAIELNPPRHVSEFRANRARSMAHTEKTSEALTEALAVAKSNPQEGDVLFGLAASYAILSGKIADKQQEYADKAMAWLTKAVAAGWKDADQMKKDSDLDSLRGREDFKKLIAALEKKAEQK